MVLCNERYDAEAIFFFEGNQVSKEMLYVEFEAVLDGIVGIPEFSSQLRHAAYVRVSQALRPEVAVLFSVGFDETGHVLTSWNLPLRYLASQAEVVAGYQDSALRVKYAHDGVEPEYEQALWDAGASLSAVLGAINTAVSNNRLAFHSGVSAPYFASGTSALGNAPASGVASAHRYGNADYLSRNFDSLLSDQKSSAYSEVETRFAERLAQLQAENAVLRDQNSNLQQQLDSLEQETRRQISQIVENYQTKLDAALSDQETHWQQVLSEKEIALHYAQEHAQQVRDQMTHLEASREADCQTAITDFIGQLLGQGVELIVTEKGVGSHALGEDQLRLYLEDKAAFWAQRYGVTPGHYQAWVTHYRRPVCQAGASTGCECGKSVARTEDPRQFVPGQHDMCTSHRLQPSSDGY